MHTGDEMPEHGERLAVLENRMNRVEEGVANFRDFQAKGLEFFARSDERAINDEKQRSRRDQEMKDAIKFRDARHTFYIAVLGAILTAFEVYKLYRSGGH